MPDKRWVLIVTSCDWYLQFRVDSNQATVVKANLVKEQLVAIAIHKEWNSAKGLIMETNVKRKKWAKFIVKYVTVLQWLPKYTKFQLCSDFIAGITIGLTMIPQSIAYAALGGLSAQVHSENKKKIGFSF